MVVLFLLAARSGHAVPTVYLGGTSAANADRSVLMTIGESRERVNSTEAIITTSPETPIDWMRATLLDRPDGEAEGLEVEVYGIPILVGSYSPNTGELVVQGPLADHEFLWALRGLHYVNTAAAPTTSQRRISVIVSAGGELSQERIAYLGFADPGGENVDILFEDDFESGTLDPRKWRVTSGAPSIVDGRLRLANAGVTSLESFRDLPIEVDIYEKRLEAIPDGFSSALEIGPTNQGAGISFSISGGLRVINHYQYAFTGSGGTSLELPTFYQFYETYPTVGSHSIELDEQGAKFGDIETNAWRLTEDLAMNPYRRPVGIRLSTAGGGIMSIERIVVKVKRSANPYRVLVPPAALASFPSSIVLGSTGCSLQVTNLTNNWNHLSVEKFVGAPPSYPLLALGNQYWSVRGFDKYLDNSSSTVHFPYDASWLATVGLEPTEGRLLSAPIGSSFDLEGTVMEPDATGVEVSFANPSTPDSLSLPRHFAFGFDPSHDRPPVVDLNGPSVEGLDVSGGTFGWGGNPVSVVSPDALVSDPFSSGLSWMEAKLMDRLDGASERLQATGATSFDSATGVLRVEGKKSPQQYTEILRSLTYRNTATTVTLGERQIQIRVFDGIAESNIATATVMVDRARFRVLHRGEAATSGQTFDLGPQPYQGPVILPLTIRNAGLTPLEVESATLSSGLSLEFPLPVVVPGGGEYELGIRLASGYLGQRSGIFTIVTSDPTDATFSGTILADLKQPTATFTHKVSGIPINQKSFDWEFNAGDPVAPGIITVRNTSSEVPLYWSQIQLGQYYTIVDELQQGILPGESDDFAFVPKNDGPYWDTNGRLSFLTNATGASSYCGVQLRSHLPVLDVSLSPSGPKIPDNSTTVIGRAGLRGGDDLVWDLRLTNIGTMDLTFPGIDLPAGFETQGFPASIGQWLAGTCSLRFPPLEAGSIAGRVRITTNNWLNTEYEFPVSATVIDGPVIEWLTVKDRNDLDDLYPGYTNESIVKVAFGYTGAQPDQIELWVDQTPVSPAITQRRIMPWAESVEYETSRTNSSVKILGRLLYQGYPTKTITQFIIADSIAPMAPVLNAQQTDPTQMGSTVIITASDSYYQSGHSLQALISLADTESWTLLGETKRPNHGSQFTVTFPAPPDGDYDIALRLIDLAGNASVQVPTPPFRLIFNNDIEPAMTRDVPADGEYLFPIGATTDVLVSAAGVTETATLSVGLKTGLMSLGYVPANQLIDSRLELGGELNGATATLSWPWTNSRNIVGGITNAYILQDDGSVRTLPLPTANANPVVIEVGELPVTVFLGGSPSAWLAIK